jgi:hypothetical protein
MTTTISDAAQPINMRLTTLLPTPYRQPNFFMDFA